MECEEGMLIMTCTEMLLLIYGDGSGMLLLVCGEDTLMSRKTSKDIVDLLGKLCKGDSSSEDIFQQFETLATTSRRHELYRILYEWIMGDDEGFSLRSSDNVVLEMTKSAAISQSVVLRDLSDFIGFAGLNDKEEIPVQVPHFLLSNLISFCMENHKFNFIIKRTVQQLMGVVNFLKGTVLNYEKWITHFIKSNKPLLSHLHQAADYLHIPALLELTSMAVGDMKKSSVQEISDWYAGLSIPRMLSPLGIQAYSTLSELDLVS